MSRIDRGSSFEKVTARALFRLLGFYVCFTIEIYILFPSPWEREKLR
jgi:hypothetical protein